MAQLTCSKAIPRAKTAQHLLAAFIAWSRSRGHAHDATGAGVTHSPTWPGAAGCPQTPDATAMLKLRDWHLLQASELVGADHAQRWQRAKRLHIAAQRFMAGAVAVLVEPEGTTQHASRSWTLCCGTQHEPVAASCPTARRYAQLLDG